MVGVAVNVTFVPVHIVLPVFAAIVTAGVTEEVTFIVMPADVAVAGLTHASDDVITTVITLPFYAILRDQKLLFRFVQTEVLP